MIDGYGDEELVLSRQKVTSVFAGQGLTRFLLLKILGVSPQLRTIYVLLRFVLWSVSTSSNLIFRAPA